VVNECGTCKHKGTRACMSHGYEDLSESCSYKLGVNAEESMRNLNGTFIDVWTPEHDKQVRDTVLDELDKMIMKRTDELLKEFQALQIPKSIPVWERRLGVGEVLDMIEEIRQGGEIIENQFVVGAEADHE